MDNTIQQVAQAMAPFSEGPVWNAFNQLAQDAGFHDGGPLITEMDRMEYCRIISEWWTRCQGTTPEAHCDAQFEC